MTRQPAMFLGHGSPMTTITPNPERDALAALGRRLSPPDAILCVTAHWQTQGKTHVTLGDRPKTIHDFYGFPAELYAVEYPAPGSRALVDRVSGLLSEDRVLPDESWGFDHGVWGVLVPMFPQGQVPVVAMSLDMTRTPGDHLALARRLAPLRDEGVMIVASGNIVHNLALWRQSAGTVPDWADRFRNRINAALENDDDTALTTFAQGDADAARAINSGEHYLPLLYAAGARLPGDRLTIFNDNIDGALSMTSLIYEAQ